MSYKSDMKNLFPLGVSFGMLKKLRQNFVTAAPMEIGNSEGHNAGFHMYERFLCSMAALNG